MFSTIKTLLNRIGTLAPAQQLKDMSTHKAIVKRHSFLHCKDWCKNKHTTANFNFMLWLLQTYSHCKHRFTGKKKQTNRAAEAKQELILTSTQAYKNMKHKRMSNNHNKPCSKNCFNRSLPSLSGCICSEAAESCQVLKV